jgi:hypothetical protein
VPKIAQLKPFQASGFRSGVPRLSDRFYRAQGVTEDVGVAGQLLASGI